MGPRWARIGDTYERIRRGMCLNVGCDPRAAATCGAWVPLLSRRPHLVKGASLHTQSSRDYAFVAVKATDTTMVLPGRRVELASIH
ncbi:hypothetical protein GWI33_007656 [Rhynchophorus ferrugineus]|uniref:Uncharacterized protein n=1 Tax=Rhynchophorus ferrugineus TaxID=354439 RepID=A0A834MGG1_RHYFE|nr:hypothetical protein GWI33_007656 [Rhynchophorus ferrugineus]